MTNQTTHRILVTDAAEGAVRSHRSRLVKNRKRVEFWLFMAPALFLFTIFMLWPAANMLRVSMLDWWRIVKPSTFIGLDNYTHMLTDNRLHSALRNTSIHMAVGMLGILPLSFAIGFFLSLRPKGYRFLRTVFFSPGMLSVSALAMLFLGLYLPEGILNTLLRSAGFDSLTRVWLANEHTALGAIIAVDFWGGLGWYGVLFFAALSGIPREIYDSARIDGASYWQMMWSIAFPMTIHYFGVLAMVLFMWILLGATQNVLLLTRGGPGDASITLGYYLYTLAFDIRNLGYSQAVGVLLLIIGVLGMIGIRVCTRRDY